MSAFDNFYKDPTPANAIKLAIDDHKAGGMIDWLFVDALNKAVALLESQELATKE